MAHTNMICDSGETEAQVIYLLSQLWASSHSESTLSVPAWSLHLCLGSWALGTPYPHFVSFAWHNLGCLLFSISVILHWFLFAPFFFYTSYETDSSLYVFLLDYLRPGKKNWDNIDWEKALSSIFNGFVLSYLMKYHKSIHLKCCWETKDLSNMSFIVWIIHIVKMPILSHWSRQSI